MISESVVHNAEINYGNPDNYNPDASEAARRHLVSAIYEALKPYLRPKNTPEARKDLEAMSKDVADVLKLVALDICDTQTPTARVDVVDAVTLYTVDNVTPPIFDAIAARGKEIPGFRLAEAIDNTSGRIGCEPYDAHKQLEAIEKLLKEVATF